MNPAAPDADVRATFIQHLLALEETEVLTLAQQRLQTGEDPFAIIADAQEALRQVGERYEQRQYYISGMMMAGEIFREVMELIEPTLAEQSCGETHGRVLLATVQGDIHDIGKSIFATLLRCHGFEVRDLGVDVAPEAVLAALQTQPADVVALSGLLTISYEAMRATARLLRQERQMTLPPILIGGGMVNAMVGGFVGADYWATDAMFGVQLCQQIVQGTA